MLAESIDRAVARHHYRLIAFVFMPEHVHLLVLPEKEASTISKLLFAIKRPFSYRIKQSLIEKESPLLDELTIRQRPGVTTFRYWQEGPGYDRNFFEPGTIETSIQYIHENPVKRGLCQKAIDWKWSSARRFVFPDQQPDSDLPKIESLPPDYVLPN